MQGGDAIGPSRIITFYTGSMMQVPGETMSRTLAPSRSRYTSIEGSSRAVRVGDFVFIGGTAPLDAIVSDGNAWHGMQDRPLRARAAP
jgi:enamine deaminase RidA (YjgF/YER057c/UK114 family)